MRVHMKKMWNDLNKCIYLRKKERVIVISDMNAKVMNVSIDEVVSK